MQVSAHTFENAPMNRQVGRIDVFQKVCLCVSV